MDKKDTVILHQSLLNNLLTNSQFKNGRLSTKGGISNVIDDFYYNLYRSHGVEENLLRKIQNENCTPEEHKKILAIIEKTLTTMPLAWSDNKDFGIYIHHHSNAIRNGRRTVATKTVQVLTDKGVYNYKSFIDAICELDLPSNPNGLWQTNPLVSYNNGLLTLEINSFNFQRLF